MTSNKTSDKKDGSVHRYIAMLEDVGLSEDGAAVYVYLLKQGEEKGASKIATGTKLHRQYVYREIDELLGKGLVEAIPHGKYKKYKAVSPSQIEKLARRRAVEAEKVAEELRAISTLGTEQDFEVMRGEYAIQRHEMQYAEHVLKGEKEYIIGGNAAGFQQAMGDMLDEYISLKDQKNIEVYYIGAKKEEANRYVTQQHFYPRYLVGLPQGVTHTVIRKDAILFFSFLNPPLVYVLYSETAAQNYRDFFLMLWDMAGE